jgi:hypothetical protein
MSLNSLFDDPELSALVAKVEAAYGPDEITWREDIPPITLLETCWKLRSPRGRVLTCGVLRTIAGLEVRCSYAQDDLIRSQYAPAIETARAIAIEWKTTAERKGFTSQSSLCADASME